MAHVAAGAAVGGASRSRLGGATAAVAVHALLDLPRHQDLERRTEIVLAAATLLAVAVMYGARSRELVGGAFGVAPDLEHLVLGERRRLFPTHRFARLHGCLATPRITPGAQIAASLLVLAALRTRRRG